MATQAGFVGRIGNIVHYKMGDKYFSRARPSKYKQTKATKIKSSLFGMASTIGSIIRQSLGSVIFEPTDRKMQNSLVSEIFQWLQIARHQNASPSNQPGLICFKFSPASPMLSNRWKVKLDISSPNPGKIQISIPSFIPKSAFVMPEGTVEIICRMVSVVIDVENKKETGTAKNEIRYTLDRNKVPAQDIFQEIATPKGCLLITGMSVEYIVQSYQRTKSTKDKAFQPSQIIHCAYY
jgi:hypothetical protein